jgi:hypothetical protein
MEIQRMLTRRIRVAEWLFLDSMVSLAIFVFAICRPSSFIRAIAADASMASSS